MNRDTGDGAVFECGSGDRQRKPQVTSIMESVAHTLEITLCFGLILQVRNPSSLRFSIYTPRSSKLGRAYCHSVYSFDSES